MPWLASWRAPSAAQANSPRLANLEALEALQPGAFSACTFDLGVRTVIVLQPAVLTGRRQSDISHEAAHLLLQHSVKQIESFGGLSFFTCDPDEEQEANWLACCYSSPRVAVACPLHRPDTNGIAAKYAVSTQMAAFRLRTTGVLRQTGRFLRFESRSEFSVCPLTAPALTSHSQTATSDVRRRSDSAEGELPNTCHSLGLRPIDTGGTDD